ELKKAIQNSQAAVVFLGPNGIGRYQKKEIQVFEKRNIEEGFKIIPVLLPGVSEPNKLSDNIFIELGKWIKFASDDDDFSLQELLESIKSERNLWAEKELERLSQEKALVNAKLEEINSGIQLLEVHLDTEECDQKEQSLAWLKAKKIRVKAYTEKVLRGFPDLKRIMKEDASRLDDLCTELEGCMDFLYFSYKSNSYEFIDEMDFTFSLSDSEVLEKSSFVDFYAVFFDHMKEDLSFSRIGEKYKNDLNTYIDYLKLNISRLT
ncbi:MAG: hypothetical protein WBB18_06270, partial [Nodosilinea sp.]